jgi:hypothetical protein
VSTGINIDPTDHVEDLERVRRVQEWHGWVEHTEMDTDVLISQFLDILRETLIRPVVPAPVKALVDRILTKWDGEDE